LRLRGRATTPGSKGRHPAGMFCARVTFAHVLGHEQVIDLGNGEWQPLAAIGPRERLPVRAGHPRVQWACLLLLAVLVSGCGSSTSGDPNGQRLRELSNDSVFAGVPMSSTMVRVRRTAARYRKPGFGGGGWAGPSVVVSFHNAKPPRVVFRYFARRAVASGWHPTANGSLGLTDRWAKAYGDGAAATLVLAQLGRSRVTSGRLYRLQGGIAPAT